MSSDPTTQSKDSPSNTRPWLVDVLPDLFGFHLMVDGRRFFIPKERLEGVIVALSIYRETPAPTGDWLSSLVGEAKADQAGSPGDASQDG